MYLFLLVPPRGGSNMLYEILQTSTSIVTMPLDEGEKYFVDMPTYLNAWAPCSCVHGFASRDIRFYRREKRYNWPRIKDIWHEAWNFKDDDRIYLEKSPPNIFRYDMLKREFPDSKFIGMIRHPYGQIDSWRRHFSNKVYNQSVFASFYADWYHHAEWLLKAKEDLKDDMLLVNYETVINDFSPIKQFIPALSDIIEPKKLYNANSISLSKYSSNEVDWINSAILDTTGDTIERIKIEKSIEIFERFAYDIFRENDLGDTDSRLFFSNKFFPLVSNERFFKYFEIDSDGLVSENVPEWMEFFNLVVRYYKIYFYKKECLL